MATKLKTMGELLRERRADASKASMARALDVENMTYSMWEQGVWNPSIRYAGALAEHLGLDRSVVLDLLYRTEMTKRDTRPYINSAAAA